MFEASEPQRLYTYTQTHYYIDTIYTWTISIVSHLIITSSAICNICRLYHECSQAFNFCLLMITCKHMQYFVFTYCRLKRQQLHVTCFHILVMETNWKSHPGRSLVVVTDDVTISQVTQLAVPRLLYSNLLLRCPPT